jgi:hypothetical protein
MKPTMTWLKVSLICLAAALCLRCTFETVTGQTPTPDHTYYTVDFVPNSSLPPDAVEAIHIQQTEARFYSERPAAKPAGLPASFVLVTVWTRLTEEQPFLTFVGWFWLDAETVKQLHEKEDGPWTPSTTTLS